MKNLIFKLLYAILFLAINPAHSESINEIAFTTLTEAFCSANKEIYQKCFHLNENDCNIMLTELLPKCGLNKDLFQIDQNDIPKFTECLHKEFEEKLIKNGIKLDEPCSK